MIKKLKTSLLTVLTLITGLLIASPAHAFDPLQNACTGQAASSAACQQASSQGTNDPIAGQNGILHTAANLIALIGGIGAVVMILLGAFFYASSGGNPEGAAKAKSRMLSGFIGLVVIAMAWVLVRFVEDKVIR